MIGLTPQQRKLYDFIAACLRETGIAPSFAEMRDALGVNSTSRISELVHALEDRRYIRRLPHLARAIEILPQAESVTLTGEIDSLVTEYARRHRIARDTAVNQMLREWFEVPQRGAA